MKASELIELLQKMVSIYGDLEVACEDVYKHTRTDVLDVIIEYSKVNGDNYKLINHKYD